MKKNAALRGAGKVLADLLPVIIFVATYNLRSRAVPETAVYTATAAFIIATAVAIVIAYARTKEIPPVLIVTGVLVLCFGGMTLGFRDPIYVKIKPTVENLFYAATIFGALMFGKNVWKMLFANAFKLPDRIWKILAIRWGLFFVAAALVNEAIRLTQSTEVWVNSRLFIGFPLVGLFMLANLPITLKNLGKSDG